ncbi:alpha/beta hydrolase [Ruminococcus albus]|uniref:Alpha/beta hydrolase family protein n=1 Tax=Ruminococcus albus TaxID=1264 RepID=A0A1I1DI89_RUMAL|nr:alpha/beta hydrolase [Ruminococcus albus]SFB72778.1 Alpha/beta hydrolase family protein [Ruminococcus albus]
MKTVIFGKKNSDTGMLLHGGGLSWWGYRRAAEILAERYQVVLPILDGHTGSDRNFTSIEDNAAEIIRFIDNELGGRVKLLGGLSLGGQVALEMLAQRGDICENAVIESALVIPSQVTAALLPSSLKMSYGLIKKEWFARKQFASLRIPDELFEDYFRDTKEISLENMTAFLVANQKYQLKSSVKDTSARVYVFAGGKEIGSVKRSAELIHSSVKDSAIKILDGLYHGEFSMRYAERYADKIMDICGGK